MEPKGLYQLRTGERNNAVGIIRGGGRSIRDDHRVDLVGHAVRC
jgi:hypothetical protein